MKLNKLVLAFSSISILAFCASASQTPFVIEGADLPPRPTTSVDEKHSFVCAAICGKAANDTDAHQGLVVFQVMAVAADRDEAFAILKKRCLSLSDQVQKIPQPDGHTPPALDLMLGFAVGATADGIRGGQFPATANNVCTLF